VASVPERPGYPWRVFFFLVTAAILSVLALLPYLTAMLSPRLPSHPLPLPLPLLATIQAAINFSVAAGVGLLLARRLSLGAPFLENWLYGRPITGGRRVLAIGGATGCGLGIVTFLTFLTPIGDPLRHIAPVAESALPIWKRFLACFYGGVGEEIFMRLFLLSLVLWLLTKIFRTAPTNRVVFWSANFLVAVLFGIGHLPFASELTVLTPSLVAVIVGLNGFVALGFGYLYWKYCFEAAVVAHFLTDLVLHVVGPMFVHS
jgi:hypothetical protein